MAQVHLPGAVWKWVVRMLGSTALWRPILNEATALRVALRSESLSPAHLEALEVRELVRPQAGSREVSIQVGQETGSSISQTGRVK